MSKALASAIKESFGSLTSALQDLTGLLKKAINDDNYVIGDVVETPDEIVNDPPKKEAPKRGKNLKVDYTALRTDFRDALIAIADQKGTETAKAILAQFGAMKAPEIPDEKLGEALTAAREALVQ